MALIKKMGFFGAPLAIMAVGAMSAQGCDPGDLAAQCGLSCDENAVANGNASVSGVQNVDAFFSAGLNLSAEAKIVAAEIRAELDAIAKSCGAAEGSSGADIAAAVNTKLEASIDGSITLEYQAPKCEISAEVTVEATAKCDVEVDPGAVKAECSGKCEAEVNAEGEFDCGADVEAQCEINGPQIECSGKCEGSCKLEAAASCSGTCKGECSGECSATTADGSCAGSCDGECTGTCEASVAAECSGSCEGKCIVEPANGKCEANATARCDASGSVDAKVECEGKCEGEVTPPSASAECEASAKAEADVRAECTPPQLALAYEFDANLDASAQAEFEAWATGTLSARVSALLALQAKAEILTDTCASFASDGVAAATGSFNTALSGDVSIQQQFGLTCAVPQVAALGEVVVDAAGELTASLNAYVEFAGELNAGF
jgi:hypothetical protein